MAYYMILDIKLDTELDDLVLKRHFIQKKVQFSHSFMARIEFNV